MNKPARYERINGKRPVNKTIRVQRMKDRIAKREGKE